MSTYVDDTYKKKGYDNDDDDGYQYAACEDVQFIPSENMRNTTFLNNRSAYPGNRRISNLDQGIPSGTILVRTAGNALQAIPAASVMEEKQQPQLVEVTIPTNSQSGDTIHVRSPYRDELIAATIPDGLYPGQTFYVQCPTTTTNVEAVEWATVATAIVRVLYSNDLRYRR
jgi:hypothetical protein